MIRIIICTVLIIFLFFCSDHAYKLGTASANVYLAEKKINEWRAEKINPKEDEWESIKRNLTIALLSDPANPDLIYHLGVAHEAYYIYYPTRNVAAKKHRIKAKAYYRDALTLRPVSPFYWVDLALVKYRLNELDDEFYAAMDNSVNLGPWEPGVQRVVIDIGLHAWRKLTPDGKAIVVNTIRNSIQHSNIEHAEAVLELVEKYNRVDVICDSGEEPEIITAHCARYRLKKNLFLKMEPVIKNF